MRERSPAHVDAALSIYYNPLALSLPLPHPVQPSPRHFLRDKMLLLSLSLSLSLALSSSVLPVRRRGVYLREGIRKCDGFDERMRFKPERPARPIQRDSWPMPGTWKENQKWKGNGEKGNSRDSLCSRNDEGNTKNSNAISVSTTRIQRKSVRESPKSHRR